LPPGYEFLGDPDYRHSGSATLLVKHAIQYVSQYTNVFDFEGSMIEGVEKSFRKFGAKQHRFLCIAKDSRNILVRMAYELATEIARAVRP